GAGLRRLSGPPPLAASLGGFPMSPTPSAPSRAPVVTADVPFLPQHPASVAGTLGINARPGAPIEASAASRVAVLAYGLFASSTFLGCFLYYAGFVGGFLTPTRLDGPLAGTLGSALALDVALLGAFAVQHSVMARPWFKRRWTKIVPQVIERSTYVLVS